MSPIPFLIASLLISYGAFVTPRYSIHLPKADGHGFDSIDYYTNSRSIVVASKSFPPELISHQILVNEAEHIQTCRAVLAKNEVSILNGYLDIDQKFEIELTDEMKKGFPIPESDIRPDLIRVKGFGSYEELTNCYRLFKTLQKVKFIPYLLKGAFVIQLLGLIFESATLVLFIFLYWTGRLQRRFSKLSMGGLVVGQLVLAGLTLAVVDLRVLPRIFQVEDLSVIGRFLYVGIFLNLAGLLNVVDQVFFSSEGVKAD